MADKKGAKKTEDESDTGDSDDSSSSNTPFDNDPLKKL